MRKNLDEFQGEIDTNALDKEWSQQPVLMRYYMDRLAAAREVLETAKHEEVQKEAELAVAIRSDPSSYGLDKVTEKSVAEAMLLEPEHRAVQEKVIKAKRLVDDANTMVEMMQHRKKALESLVALFGMDYFAEPRESSGPKPRAKPKGVRQS